MQEKIIWFITLIKLRFRRKTVWCMCILLPVCLLIASKLYTGQEQNTAIAVCDLDQSPVSGQIVKQLLQRESLFTFYEVESQEQVTQDVYAGKAFCGFVLQKGLQNRLQDQKAEKSILYACQTVSAQGRIAQETVFAVVFDAQAEAMLMSNAASVAKEAQAFGKSASDRYREYLDGDELFYVDTVRENALSATQTAQPEKIYPVQGLLALFILASMLLARGEYFEGGRKHFLEIHRRSDRIWFLYMEYLAAGVPPAFAGCIYMLCCYRTPELWKSVGWMPVYLLIAAGWTVLIQLCLRKQDTYYAWMMTLLFTNAAVAPVFMNFTAYIPVLKVIRMIFPVGIYINLLM